MVEFGEQLRRAREAKGMTQQSLAEQLYVTRQSVSRWECGDRYPDLLTTKKISLILDVSLDDLLSGKEMTKVVERNPVVENKAVNSVMIVVYALVVLSYLITVVDIVFRLTLVPDDANNPPLINFLVIQVLGLSIPVVAFLYGLVNAIRGTLSPKRLGAILVAFFAISIVATKTNHMMQLKAWQYFAVIGAGVVLPNLLAGIAAFFFFIRADNRKIWICVIALTSVWGIIRHTAMFETDMPLALNISSRIVLSIAIYALILYQTYTLYKKRFNAIDANEQTT